MRAKNKAVNNRLLLLTIIVNVLIPKAGIKIGEIPLTLGSVLLGILIFVFSFSLLLEKKNKMNSIELMVFFEISYFLVRLLFTCFLIGSISLFTFPFIISLSIYPLIYFVVKHYVSTEKQVLEIYNIIDKCVMLLFIYAIVQFIFGIGNTDIPGITVNYSDYIEDPTRWWMHKANGTVEGQTKMFSTYQNGNNFGLSILLLFPLCFNKIDRKPASKIIYFVMYVIICMLSGSRTAVLGCILYILIILTGVLKERHMKKKTISYLLLMFIPCIAALTYFFSQNVDAFFVTRALSIFDRDTLIKGAGRTDSMLKYFNWLFSEIRPVSFVFGADGLNYEGGAYEMTYVAVFVIGGIIGLTLFMIPIVYYLKRGMVYLKKCNNWLVKGAWEGLLVYSVAAFVEGAYFVPPAAINVWTVMALMDILTNGSNEGD